MELSEQDEKRLYELAIQLETIHNKINSLLSPLTSEGRISINSEQMKELTGLYDQEDSIKAEFMSIPNYE
jgi:hypothetical protein